MRNGNRNGLFYMDLFSGEGGLGNLPAGAQGIAYLRSFREQYPGLPSEADLLTRGVTHFVTAPIAPGRPGRTFDLLASDGRLVERLSLTPPGVEPPGPVPPDLSFPGTSVPAKGGGQKATPGPSSTSSTSASIFTTQMPTWVPWAAAGVATLVAIGGVVYLSGGMTPNRRSRRRRRRR